MMYDREEAKAEIYENGPVFGTMTVFQDFSGYTDGIYEYKKGEIVMEHAIVFLGWGKENGVDYWVCANSWGDLWADHGYFKIKMGEVNTDRYWVSAIPDISRI
jgi:cathepsin B